MTLASSKDEARARRLVSLFEKTNADGTLCFSKQDVLELLPLLLLSATKTVSMDDLPESVLAIIGEFAHRAGVPRGASRDEAKTAVDASYKAHPINPELLAAFKDLVREEFSGAVDSEAAVAFAKFAGERLSQLHESDEPAPEGSIKAGVFSQFDLGKK